MSASPTTFHCHVTESESEITIGFPPDTALTEANAEPFQKELLALVARRDQPHLVVDLSGITILTSVILGKFIAINQRVRAAGGRLTLRNPTPTVRMVFNVTKLDTVLDVQPVAEGMPV